jgi:hypothetical protein
VDLPPEGTAPTGADELDKIRRELIAAAAPAELMALVDEMNAQGHPVASVARAVEIVRPFLKTDVGGYKMARLLDPSLTPAEANANRATAAALAIVEALGADAFGYDAIVKPEKFNVDDDLV